MASQEVRLRHKQGAGGIAITFIVDGALHYLLDWATLVPIGMGLAAMVAVWAFAPDFAAYIPNSFNRRKSSMPMVLMVVGVLLFCGGAIWSAVMAGPDKPQDGSSKPPVSSSPSSTNQQGGQTGGTINNNGPVYNGPGTQAVPQESKAPDPNQPLFELHDHAKATFNDVNIHGESPKILNAHGHSNLIVDGLSIVSDPKFMVMPPPDGSKKKLNNIELRAALLQLADSLERYQLELDKNDVLGPIKRGDSSEAIDAKVAYRAKQKKLVKLEFVSRFQSEARSLVSEAIARNDKITRPEVKPMQSNDIWEILERRNGWDTIATTDMNSDRPIHNVALLLESIAAAVPN